MRHFILLGILLFPTLSCANRVANPHLAAKPLSVSTIAVLCDFPRHYKAHLGSTTEQERLWLQEALAEINAVAPGTVVYDGTFEDENDVPYLLLSGVTVLGAPPTRYNPLSKKESMEHQGILAVTSMAWNRRGCLVGLAIVLLIDSTKFPSPDYGRSVVFHEVLHSIGFSHQEPVSPTESLMKPAIQRDPIRGYSESDKNSIRAVYGR